jgi:hypothetical protein
MRVVRTALNARIVAAAGHHRRTAERQSVRQQAPAALDGRDAAPDHPRAPDDVGVGVAAREQVGIHQDDVERRADVVGEGAKQVLSAATL